MDSVSERYRKDSIKRLNEAFLFTNELKETHYTERLKMIAIYFYLLSCAGKWKNEISRLFSSPR